MRQISELRIQLTRKNNFPRLYDYDLFEDKEVKFSDEEIIAVVKAAADLGIKAVRFTGGEPLERENLVELIKSVKAVEGIEALSMTTSGILLAGKAKELKAAGLDSVNVLLDTFFEEKYIYMTGGGPIDEAMDGLEACVNEGMNPLRVEATIIEGINDDEILTFGQFALNEPIDILFTEKENKEGEKLKDSDKELKFMSAEDIRKKFRGAINIPSKDPLIECCKWFEAKGKIGFTDLKRARIHGAEVTAEGKLKKALLDNEPKDIKEAIQSLNIDIIKAALEENL